MGKFSKERLTALKNEIKMAEVINREELLPILQESLHRYIGDFVPPYGGNWDILINEVYPIIQNHLPAIFFRNPRAFLKPKNKTYIAKQRDPISGKMVDTEMDATKSANTQEHILNYCVMEIGYKKEARRWLLDALLFPYGVLWHGYKGDFGMTEEQSILIKNEQVFVKRISPMKFLHDPAVNITNLDEGRWVARAIDIPLQDLLEDDKLDVDKKLIKGYRAFGQQVSTAVHRELKAKGARLGGKDIISLSPTPTLIDFTDKKYQESDWCRYITVYEVFVRPTKKEKREGSKGWVLLITDEQEAPLRENNWTVKAEGFPSKILEFNELPDNMFGIADVSTYKSIADHKNVVINMQLRNAQETAKTWVGISREGTNEEDVQKVQEGQNTILLFEGGNPRDKMFVASGGGQASSELYMLDQRIQKNLEDKSGITDLKRGFLQSGEESATSVKIRNAGGNARPMYRQDIMSEALKESFRYINQLNKQFLPYDKAVRIIGSLDLEWSENPTLEDIQAETDVDIDVISMLPENPEKELQELQTMLTLMFEGLTNPVIQAKIAQEGKIINISPIIEQMLLRIRLRNPEIFRNIQPGESEGYVSIQQVREAKDNVLAALQGQNPPFPPKEGDDHRAKLETYSTVAAILEMAGQVSDILQQLMQIQSALLEQEMSKEASPGRQLKAPKLEMAGG
jgi:hypothetical protein